MVKQNILMLNYRNFQNSLICAIIFLINADDLHMVGVTANRVYPRKQDKYTMDLG